MQHLQLFCSDTLYTHQLQDQHTFSKELFFIKLFIGISPLKGCRLDELFTSKSLWFFLLLQRHQTRRSVVSILFCLAEEVLSRGLLQLVSSSQLMSMHPQRGLCAPCHVRCVMRNNLRCVMRFIVEYGLYSGQLVNKSHYVVFLGKYAQPRQRYIRNLLDIGVSLFPFEYLGARTSYKFLLVGNPENQLIKKTLLQFGLYSI